LTIVSVDRLNKHSLVWLLSQNYFVIVLLKVTLFLVLLVWRIKVS